MGFLALASTPARNDQITRDFDHDACERVKPLHDCAYQNNPSQAARPTRTSHSFLIMDRIKLLQADKNKAQLGLEVGPYFSPIFPKKDGWNAFALDVFETADLIERAKLDPAIGERHKDIEAVDFLFKGSLLESVLEKLSEADAKRVTGGEGYFDYIASSHNFEHQPNPIQFLLDCSQLLKAGGMLTMAIPIGTRCFDRMRPLSTTGHMIDAYLSNAAKPSTGQLVDHFLNVVYDTTSQTPIHHQFYRSDQLAMWYGRPDTQWNPIFFNSMLADKDTKTYHDAHCWIMNRHSLELILTDLKMLGILPELNVASTIDLGLEFIINLVKDSKPMETAKDRCALTADANHYYAAEVIRLKPLTIDWTYPQ